MSNDQFYAKCLFHQSVQSTKFATNIIICYSLVTMYTWCCPAYRIWWMTCNPSNIENTWSLYIWDQVVSILLGLHVNIMLNPVTYNNVICSLKWTKYMWKSQRILVMISGKLILWMNNLYFYGHHVIISTYFLIVIWSYICLLCCKVENWNK